MVKISCIACQLKQTIEVTLWMLFLQIMTHHIVSVEGSSINASLESSSVTPTPTLTAFMMQTLLNVTNLQTKVTTIAVSSDHGMNATIYLPSMNDIISATPSSNAYKMETSSNSIRMHTEVTVVANSGSNQMNATPKSQSMNSTIISMEGNSVTISLDASSVSPTLLLNEFTIMQTLNSINIDMTIVPSVAISNSHGINKTIHSGSINSTVIPSQTPTSCTNCNQNRSTDKEFKYMMMGIGIGAAFLFFVIFFTVAVCMKRKRSRKPTRNYGGLSPEEAEANFFRSKDSIFSSSTLQLRGGLNNDALEMEAFQSPSNLHQISKHDSTFRSDPDPEPENLTVHVNMESVDIVPTGFQPTVTKGLGKEQKHDASIRLLQKWHEDLNNEESEIYKELKHDIEESIRDLYRMKQGFKDVNMKSLRKGSIIADLILIMLAVVTDPLDILAKSVAHGKIGSFKVDKHFPVSKGANEDETDHGKNQPNLKEALSSGAQNTEIDQDKTGHSRQIVVSGTTENSQESFDASGSFDNHSYENHPSDISPVKSPIHGVVVEESSTDGAMPLQRPLSLADLNNVKSPLKFREQRDSGIGSMQELNKWEPHRISRQEEIPETEETVFYDTPDSPRSGVKIAKEAHKQVLLKTDEESPTVAYVALYDFIGKGSRELSMKQGEVVHVISSESSGWIKVVNEDEKKGWVPVCFIVLVSETQLTNTQQTVEILEYFDNVLEQLDSEKGSCSSGGSSPREDEYTYPIEPSVDDNIYSTPEEVESHEYLTLVPDDNLQIQVKRCKSVYAFASKDATELSIKEGEIIHVLKTTETGWWKGQIDEREGWFPSSYVMPLNEQSEIALPEQTSVADKAKTTRFDSQARAIDKRLQRKDRANSTQAIYAEPDTPIQRGEHKYQSLQRTFKLPEQYTHLYFQILKRETKSDEDIPKSCKSFDVESANTDSNLDRPIRNAPAPPKEDKPVVPPKDVTIKPKVPSKRNAQAPSKVVKGISSHGEPPKRPVPPPPTAKPIRVSSGAIKRRKSEETIFLDKQLSRDIAPPARGKYENLPEKHRHSAHFIIKETVKDPVPIVSLKSAVLKSESDKTKIDRNVSRIASVPNAAIEAKMDPSSSNVNQIFFPERSASFPENELPSRRSKIDVPSKPLPKLNKAESDNRKKSPPVAIRPKSTFAEVSKPKIPTKPLPVLAKTNDLPERPIVPGKPVKQHQEDGPIGATPNLALESTAKSKPVVPVGPGLIINKDDILAKKRKLVKSVEVKGSSDKPHSQRGKSTETAIEKKIPPARPEAPTHAKIESKDETIETLGHNKALPTKRQISIEQSHADLDVKSEKEVVDTRPPKPAVRQQSTDTAIQDVNSAKEAANPGIPVTKKPPLPNIKAHVSIDVAKTQSTDLMKSKVLETGVDTASEKNDVKSAVSPPAKPKLPVKPSLSTQTSVEKKNLENKPIPAKRTDSQSGVAATKKPQPEASSPKKEHKETPVPVPRVKLAKSEEPNAVKQEFEVSLTRCPAGTKEKPERPALPDLTESPKLDKPDRPAPPNVTDYPKGGKPSRPTPPNVADSPKREKPNRPPAPHLTDHPKLEKPERPTPPHLKDSPKSASPKSRTKDKTKLRKVIKEYIGKSCKELNLNVGDMLFELDEARAQGKCYGLLENGQEGWYPVDHVERVYPES